MLPPYSYSGRAEMMEAMHSTFQLYGQRKRTAGKNKSGFSLIELLIVIAIILVIAAIAIPNLIRSRMQANEAAAVAQTRYLNTAEVAYLSTYGGHSPSLAALGPPGGGGGATALAADLIDNVMASGIKGGYSYVYTPSAPVGGLIFGYTINANPLNMGSTGQRGFYSDQTGVIRFHINGVATIADSPVN